jgi:hypothetical protein
MPLNSFTMARKLEVSVVSTVAGARRNARARFLDLLGFGTCTRHSNKFINHKSAPEEF